MAIVNLLVRLMHLLSQRGSNLSLPELDRLATLLGRFYQVRDDYINLQDNSCSEQKGFCEDLDEGNSRSLSSRGSTARTLLR